jgi:hypothetical protein
MSKLAIPRSDSKTSARRGTNCGTWSHLAPALRPPRATTYLAYYVKAIQLAEQLHERALDLTIGARALAEAAAANRINLRQRQRCELL